MEKIGKFTGSLEAFQMCDSLRVRTNEMIDKIAELEAKLSKLEQPKEVKEEVKKK